MILTCSACSARYEIAADSIPSRGRPVKCAACDHRWTAYNSSRAQHKPFRPGSVGTAGAGMPGAFSAPRSSQGSAALAALFEGYEDQAPALETMPQDAEELSYYGAADVLETEWREVEREDIDSRIDTALATPAIARLVDQNRRATPSQPHRPVEKKPPLMEAANSPTAEAPAERSPAGGGPVRSLSRGLISLLEGLAEGADWLLSRLFRAGERGPEPVVTPGDRKVTEWRLEQIRRARKRMTLAKLAGWVCFSGALVGLAYGGIAWRNDIADAWPKAGAALALAGLTSPGEPVSIASLDHRFAHSPQGPVVELVGTVRHDGDQMLRAPLIRAEAQDSAGTVLASWAFALEGSGSLAPASDTPFRTRALAPEGTSAVRVSLMTPQERAALEAELPEVITALNGGAGGNAFFMRKTTSGWGADPDPVPVEPRMRD